MSPRWWAVLSLVVIVVGVTAVIGGVASGTDAGVDVDVSLTTDVDQDRKYLSQPVAATQTPVLPQAEGIPEADATVTRITVAPNGTAEWRFRILITLDTNESIEAFAAFEREFTANRSQFLDRFRERIVGVVDSARNKTDRAMTADRFAVETGTDELAAQRRGFVNYEFRWRNFAATDSGTISAGDVFQAGLFLEADDVLRIEGPPGYETASVAPGPDDRTTGRLRWSGPLSFDDQRPAVTFAAGDDTTGEPDAPDRGSGGGVPVRLLVLVGGLLLLGTGLGAGYLRWRTTADRADPPPPAPAPARNEADHTADGSASQSGATAADPSDPGELATDEDRVVAVLEAEDGRMRQATIAERLGWSDSKTSRVLSGMVETGTVEKLRIGRENVIDLREHDQDQDQDQDKD